jgi:Recombination endonuclease VII
MECKEVGCHSPAYCRGLCNRDYQRWLGAQEPRPAVLTCRNCGTDFPNPVRQGPDRQFCSPQCKGKYWGAERARQRAAAPPRPCGKCGAPVTNRTGRAVCAACRVDDRSRPYRAAYMLEYTLRQHGLTRADYERMIAAQDGRCAICRSSTPLGRGRWHIDHDHVTGQVRGLLCNNCNRGIGYFGDDPEVIAAAARYVAEARQQMRTAARPVER